MSKLPFPPITYNTLVHTHTTVHKIHLGCGVVCVYVCCSEAVIKLQQAAQIEEYSM